MKICRTITKMYLILSVTESLVSDPIADHCEIKIKKSNVDKKRLATKSENLFFTILSPRNGWRLHENVHNDFKSEAILGMPCIN